MRRWLTIVIAAIAPRVAHASGALEELSAGAALAPGSGWISNKLAGIWDLDARWQLRLDLSSTRAYSDASDSTRDDVHLGSLAAVYAPDDHWSLRLTGGWSPESTMRAPVPVSVSGPAGGTMLADAHLRAAVSSRAFGAGIDYDTATDDVHSLSASLSVNATYFNTQQEVLIVDDPSGASSTPPDAVRMQRRSRLEARGSAVVVAWPQRVQLGQFALGASITDTVDGDTDLTVDASYYLYDQDPLQPGYLALATMVSGSLGSATSAPLLRDAIAPSVAHRWGNVAVSVSLAFSDYVDGHQSDLGANLSVQYKLALAGTHRLKLSARLAAGAHSDANPALTCSGSTGFGAQYTW